MADLRIDIGSIWMDIADDDDIVLYLAAGRTAFPIHMSEKEFGHLEHYVRLLREHLDKHRGEE